MIQVRNQNAKYTIVNTHAPPNAVHQPVFFNDLGERLSREQRGQPITLVDNFNLVLDDLDVSGASVSARRTRAYAKQHTV
jgi:hypothetical protein